MKNNNKSIKYIVEAAIIAALYIVLTLVSQAFGLASGAVQLRLSEALTILPCFLNSAIPGLFVGCMFANLLTGCAIFDILIGGLASLIGAVGTYYLRRNKYLAVIPPIISNTVLVPLVLKFGYHLENAYIYLVITIALGEIISCGVLGILCYNIIKGKKVFKWMH